MSEAESSKIVARKKDSGLVPMKKDPTEGAIILPKYKDRKDFAPKITDELIRSEGEIESRPKVEFPDVHPILQVQQVAVAQGYSKDQVIQFIQQFHDYMQPKGEPYAQRNIGDYVIPPVDVAGNDGIWVWNEIYKYGRQTVARVCKKLGAYDPMYTQLLITALVNSCYVFLYEDGTVDAIPQDVRDKILHPPEPQHVIDERKHIFKVLPSLSSMDKIILDKDKDPKKLDDRIQIVETVEEKDYVESAKLKPKRIIIKNQHGAKEDMGDAIEYGLDDSPNTDSHGSGTLIQ